MNIIMRKPTQFRSKFYSRNGKPYTVEDAVGKRWIKRKIAVLAPEEDTPFEGAVQEGFKNEISKEEVALGHKMENIKEFVIDSPPKVDPENNGTPNIKELKLMAKAAAIPGYSRMSKGQLLEALDGDNNAR